MYWHVGGWGAGAARVARVSNIIQSSLAQLSMLFTRARGFGKHGEHLTRLSRRLGADRAPSCNVAA